MTRPVISIMEICIHSVCSITMASTLVNYIFWTCKGCHFHRQDNYLATDNTTQQLMFIVNVQTSLHDSYTLDSYLATYIVIASHLSNPVYGKYLWTVRFSGKIQLYYLTAIMRGCSYNLCVPCKG